MINGVRNFKLINKIGAEYDMTRPDALLWNPNGLGWGMDTSTERLGLTYSVTESRQTQSSPSGTMVFRDYEEYRRFLEFCQVGGLVFCYKPLETWYYLKVSIKIEKDEIKPENNHLLCPVSFLGLSYWYEELRAETGTISEDGGKVYDYTYSYTYSDGAQNVFEFNLPLDSYFKLTIMGECTNPQYRVTVNGEKVKEGKVNCHISSTHKFVVDSRPNSVEISEYTKTDEFVQSLYGSSNFATQRIFALPQGESKLIVLTDDVTIPTVLIEVFKNV